MKEQHSWTPYLSNSNADKLSHNDSTVVRTFYGDPSVNNLTNTLIINASIEFLSKELMVY